MDWTETCRMLPPDGVTVMTKIDTEDGGVRNVQPLKRQRNLWFYPDSNIYVYYCPTHWRPIPYDRRGSYVSR